MQGKRKISWQRIAIIILAVCLIFVFVKIGQLTEYITYVESQLSQLADNTYQLEGQIGSIYTNVDEKMKEQASLLSSVDYSYGKFDVNTNSASVEMEIVPKSITEDMKVSVFVGEQEIEFVREKKQFVATFMVNAFEWFEKDPILCIKNAEETKTEILEEVDVSLLYQNYLPEVRISTDIMDSEYSKGTLAVQGDVQIEAQPSDEASITKCELVVEVNGKEVKRKDITSEFEDGIYEGTIKENYSMKNGDELSICVIAEDSLGYIHRTFEQGYIEDGHIGTTVGVDDNMWIYDSKGKLLTGEE